MIREEKSRILVVGSANTDMVISAEHFPLPGETMMGHGFMTNHGGKGANQAVAAARLEGNTAFIGKVGDDQFGHSTIEMMKGEGIDVSGPTVTSEQASGVALITTVPSGENSIIVAPGANSTLSYEDIDKAEERIKECDIILMQLEVPIETAEYAASLANKYNKKVILNPAPASTLNETFLNKVHTILPNRIEAEMLTGIKVISIDSAHRAAKAIGEKGINNVVITLGKDGAYVKEKEEYAFIPAKTVKTVDTTGAGDVFCGAFSFHLSLKHSVIESVKFANAAAAISVTRRGAQSAIPYIREIIL